MFFLASIHLLLHMATIKELTIGVCNVIVNDIYEKSLHAEEIGKHLKKVSKKINLIFFKKKINYILLDCFWSNFNLRF